MSTTEFRYAARLPLWVLIGGALGVLVGLLFGEEAGNLRPIGTTYVMLMEVVVLPYIICSLLHGLGRLSPEMARRLLRCSWLVYVAVWGITFLVIFLLTLAIPAAPPPSFIDARVQARDLGLIELLIPSNLFVDLMRNYLPAIVIFSIIFGVAIQRVKEKETFLSLLDLIRTASVTIWGWVVLLAPLGVFALFADTVGTIAPDELANLSIYLIALVVGCAVLAFWILPSVIAALCPISTKEVIRDLQNALIISIVTTLSVAALPFIQQAAEKLARRAEIEDENSSEIIQTSLAVSYPLAQLGNFFIWLFIIFATFYFRVPISAAEHLTLPFVTLLSGFGSPSSSIGAVSFLSQWLSLPAGAPNLYVGMMTITRYAQVVASVMGFAFVTFLVTMSYYGKLKLKLPRLIGSMAIATVFVIVATVAVQIFQREVVQQRPNPYLAFKLGDDVTRGVSVVIEKPRAANAGPPPAPDQGAILHRIQTSGELKVGFNPNIIPFSYRNTSGELVGFDIAHAYRLARDLSVRLRLIPFTWDGLEEDMAARRFDLALSGIYVTNTRIQRYALSDPYMKSPIAFIVRADAVDRFLDRKAIEAQSNPTISVFRDPVMSKLVQRLIPDANVVVLPSYDALPSRPDINAGLWTLIQAKAWTAHRPRYTAIVPKDLGGEILIAYLMPKNSAQFRSFVNYWLKVQQVNGFTQRMTKHWIEGKTPRKRAHRWSILGSLLETPEK